MASSASSVTPQECGASPAPRRQQQGGGGARSGPQPSLNWKDTVRADEAGERPAWRLTCYGHEREGPNDLEGGDVSFEELRWAQLQVCCAAINVSRLGNQRASLSLLLRRLYS